MSGRKRRHGIAWVVLTLSVCVMAVAGYKYWAAEQVYTEGDKSYEQLSDLVRPAGPPIVSPQDTNTTPSDVPATAEPNVEIPYMDIDFEALRAINQNAAAWLYCPDTVIDYPVMRANDYDYYLRHLPDGTRNDNGTLFIDYNNAAGFTDALTVIYGHHMKSGKMFGSLVNYKGQAYFEEHPYMYLYTENGNYRIDLMYGCVIGAGQWRDQGFMYEANLDALLTYAASKTTFTCDVAYIQGDQVIALSTCSYEFDDARYVVLGLLRPEYGPVSDTPEP